MEKKFLCVVSVVNGEITFNVPHIGYLMDEGFDVEPIEVHHRDGRTDLYEVTIDDKRTIEVTCWRNVHPDGWSQELYQLNKSFE